MPKILVTFLYSSHNLFLSFCHCFPKILMTFFSCRHLLMTVFAPHLTPLALLLYVPAPPPSLHTNSYCTLHKILLHTFEFLLHTLCSKTHYFRPWYFIFSFKIIYHLFIILLFVWCNCVWSNCNLPRCIFRCSGWSPKYAINNAQDETVFLVDSPCCPCQCVCCPRDIQFPVRFSQSVNSSVIKSTS